MGYPGSACLTLAPLTPQHPPVAPLSCWPRLLAAGLRALHLPFLQFLYKRCSV